MDEPEHRRMRNLLQGAFSKREMAWWETEIIRPVVDHHLGAIASQGRADLYRSVANKVPIHTSVSALGLTESDREWFFDQAVLMTSNAEPVEARVAATAAIDAYIAPLIAERRLRPTRDLLSVLVQAVVADPEDPGPQADDRPLDDEEIGTFVKLLVIAGAGTTFRAYTNLMWALLSNPDQYAEVAADRSLLEAAVEESLRFEEPLTFVTRQVVRDTSIGEVAVPSGCPVHVSIGAANRDPAEWPDPDRFDVHRAHPERHLTFGWGSHRCLGVHLARTELRVLLDRTIDLLPNLRLDPDVEAPTPGGVGFRMVSPLWVRFDPAP
jgi:cytochrome P450